MLFRNVFTFILRAQNAFFYFNGMQCEAARMFFCLKHDIKNKRAPFCPLKEIKEKKIDLSMGGQWDNFREMGEVREEKDEWGNTVWR